MKLNPLFLAGLATTATLIATPAFAGGNNGNNGQGNNCQGNSCGNGNTGGGSSVGDVTNTNTNANLNANSNSNSNRNTNNNSNVAKGGDATAIQGQLQGQAQGQLQGQGQQQQVVGSGNSAQGQSQATVVGGQANAQSTNVAVNNSSVYLPERINPMPTIDYANVQIGDVACPTGGVVGGVSYADGNYGLQNYGAGSDLTASLGFQLPFGTRGCRDEQARVRASRLIAQCVAMQRAGVVLNAQVFPEFNKCSGVSVATPVTLVVPVPQAEQPKPVRGLW